MPFLHCIRDTVVRDKARTRLYQETFGKTGKCQWNKGPILKEATKSEKGEDIQQDIQENHRAGDREANSQVFWQDSKNK
jgi:hypothetical protein